jgi:hypothetical protein
MSQTFRANAVCDIAFGCAYPSQRPVALHKKTRRADALNAPFAAPDRCRSQADLGRRHENGVSQIHAATPFLLPLAEDLGSLKKAIMASRATSASEMKRCFASLFMRRFSDFGNLNASFVS